MVDPKSLGMESSIAFASASASPPPWILRVRQNFESLRSPESRLFGSKDFKMPYESSTEEIGCAFDGRGEFTLYFADSRLCISVGLREFCTFKVRESFPRELEKQLTVHARLKVGYSFAVNVKTFAQRTDECLVILLFQRRSFAEHTMEVARGFTLSGLDELELLVVDRPCDTGHAV